MVVHARVSARTIAAVRRRVPPGTTGTAWREPLDKVWAFLRTQPGLRTDGHNTFLYHHADGPGSPMEVDYGVEVIRRFDPSGEVRPVEAPAGEVAIATHVGPYDRMLFAHAAVHDWVKDNRRELAGRSWEIYGDWTDDPAKLETTIVYLLR